ncbi:hypothetical protein [Capnocytophaga canimorsus]|uniref:hypothetical protein n=1 Tax=Capnocytophaga canimorsus TaxID=28188 RepID=UPI0028E78A5E|nr:hypothetical protein [Capnocytophaga canimorsus]MDT9499607.1 hypothetical protein [Capnocytophaga canimorsus]
MDFPANLVITSTLKIGVVYKMVAPELITTSEPHYFVIVAVNNKDNYMLMSTTKYKERLEYIKKKGYNLDTLRRIEPNNNNGLTQDSFFDCNKYYTITKEKLIEKAQNKELKLAGNFSLQEYQDLVFSIELSEVNDIPKYLLKYEDK